jgi:hypothetical protein
MLTQRRENGSWRRQNPESRLRGHGQDDGHRVAAMAGNSEVRALHPHKAKNLKLRVPTARDVHNPLVRQAQGGRAPRNLLHHRRGPWWT